MDPWRQVLGTATYATKVVPSFATRACKIFCEGTGCGCATILGPEKGENKQNATECCGPFFSPSFSCLLLRLFFQLKKYQDDNELGKKQMTCHWLQYHLWLHEIHVVFWIESPQRDGCFFSKSMGTLLDLEMDSLLHYLKNDTTLFPCFFLPKDLWWLYERLWRWWSYLVFNFCDSVDNHSDYLSIY